MELMRKRELPRKRKNEEVGRATYREKKNRYPL